MWFKKLLFKEGRAPKEAAMETVNKKELMKKSNNVFSLINFLHHKLMTHHQATREVMLVTKRKIHHSTITAALVLTIRKTLKLSEVWNDLEP